MSLTENIAQPAAIMQVANSTQNAIARHCLNTQKLALPQNLLEPAAAIVQCVERSQTTGFLSALIPWICQGMYLHECFIWCPPWPPCRFADIATVAKAVCCFPRLRLKACHSPSANELPPVASLRSRREVSIPKRRSAVVCDALCALRVSQKVLHLFGEVGEVAPNLHEVLFGPTGNEQVVPVLYPIQLVGDDDRVAVEEILTAAGITHACIALSVTSCHRTQADRWMTNLLCALGTATCNARALKPPHPANLTIVSCDLTT